MKQIKFIIAIFLFFSLKTKSQTNVVFSYDNAGNIIQRQIQIMPPLPGGGGRYINPDSSKDTNNITTPINFKIYPNPAQTYLTIEGNLPENTNEAKLQLLSNTGQVLKTNFYTGETKTVDVSDLKNGIYLLEIIYSKKQKSTYKIIITN